MSTQNSEGAAPKVTPAAIEAEIVSEWYFTAADGAHARFVEMKGDSPWGTPLEYLTFCVLVLRNGFTVTGESACVSPQNFNAETGRRIAREKAVDKLASEAQARALQNLVPLRWHMEYIDNVDEDLREWEAPSIIHEDLSAFYYRIQETTNPQARFVEASDTELMSGEPRTWSTIEEAQAALQADHEAAVKSVMAERGQG